MNYTYQCIRTIHFELYCISSILWYVVIMFKYGSNLGLHGTKSAPWQQCQRAWLLCGVLWDGWSISVWGTLGWEKYGWRMREGCLCDCHYGSVCALTAIPMSLAVWHCGQGAGLVPVDPGSSASSYLQNYVIAKAIFKLNYLSNRKWATSAPLWERHTML